MSEIDNIYSKLSAKFNLDSEVIEKIARSQFDFTVNTMEQGEFQSIRLHHLGVFGIKPARLVQLKERSEKKIYLQNS